MAPAATIAYKRLASLIANKRQQTYSKTSPGFAAVSTSHIFLCFCTYNFTIKICSSFGPCTLTHSITWFCIIVKEKYPKK